MVPSFIAKFRFFVWGVLSLCLCCFTFLGAGSADERVVQDDAAKALSQQAHAVLQKYCIKCHGPQKQESDLRLDTASGFIAGGESEEPLAAATLEDAYLWARVGIYEDMPPEGEPQPSTEEKEILRKWIMSGAKYPETLEFVSTRAPDLASEVARVFDQYCVNCHGAQKKGGYLDLREHASLIEARVQEKSPYIVPNNPEQSRLWKKVASGSMPPKDQRQLTEEDRLIIHAWIKAGAPYFPPPGEQRPFVSELNVQRAIVRHLETKRPSTAKHQRYFTFTHLHNNPEISNRKLRLFKAGLAKLVNSLTWEAEIVRLEPVDDHQTVFAVDLRDLGWTEFDHWRQLFRHKEVPRGSPEDGEEILYPYLLDYAQISREHRDLAERVERATDSRLLSMPRLRIRADWFAANASRPPLYETLLELPDTLAELEEELEVTREKDWLESDMWRGGVLESGVSKHNRLLDRHRSLHGAYWISYDFSSSFGRGDLRRRPLGPKFEDNEFNDDLAFEQDGGEVIFRLPNGLQGYYLVDADGNRIKEGPIDIVEDANRTSGSPVIVNGLSCMACHKNGMIEFQGAIRKPALANLGIDAREKVLDLFPAQEVMSERLARDQARFLEAALEAMQPFLSIASASELRDMPEEPIGELARHYNNRDLTLAALTAELDFEDSEQLLGFIRGNRTLRDILAPLLNDGVIKRTQWETKNSGQNSAFQTVVQELEKGIPLN